MRGDILIIGGGISGITSAVEAAEIGYNVFLLEKKPYLGGRVVQMNKYFPKMCPPYCGFEINLKRIRQNPRIKYYLKAEAIKIEGKKGDYKVEVKIDPTYINENCTLCGECISSCPVDMPNEFNYNMNKTKAIYLPYEMALRYVIDNNFCNRCGECAEMCKYNAIDLDMQSHTFTLNVSSIIVASGWHPYDATKIDNLGFGRYQNVITNVMMERLASYGKIKRPSDGKDIKSIAFVQCAGSRDENHLPYCSAVCCLASLKQALYMHEQNPNSEVTIFYIDIRAMGRYEDFYNKVLCDKNISFNRGKVAKITETETKDLVIEAEDTLSSIKSKKVFNLVVLAAGIKPNKIPFISYDENGFAIESDGIYPVGVAKGPKDVSTSVCDATGAVLKAIQCIR